MMKQLILILFVFLLTGCATVKKADPLNGMIAVTDTVYKVDTIVSPTVTPEMVMKEAFYHYFKARENFERAIPLYKSRNDDFKADSLNTEAVIKTLHYMALSYDELSAIWENDIEH